jgi:hypothetical protein
MPCRIGQVQSVSCPLLSFFISSDNSTPTVEDVEKRKSAVGIRSKQDIRPIRDLLRNGKLKHKKSPICFIFIRAPYQTITNCSIRLTYLQDYCRIKTNTNDCHSPYTHSTMLHVYLCTHCLLSPSLSSMRRISNYEK